MQSDAAFDPSACRAALAVILGESPGDVRAAIATLDDMAAHAPDATLRHYLFRRSYAKAQQFLATGENSPHYGAMPMG